MQDSGVVDPRLRTGALALSIVSVRLAVIYFSACVAARQLSIHWNWTQDTYRVFPVFAASSRVCYHFWVSLFPKHKLPIDIMGGDPVPIP